MYICIQALTLNVTWSIQVTVFLFHMLGLWVILHPLPFDPVLPMSFAWCFFP